MKILITAFTYWPNVDGVQNVTTYQAEKLAEFGHDVTVITSKSDGRPDREKHNKVNIVRVPAYKAGLWAKGDKSETQKKFLEYAFEADVYINVCFFDYLSQWILPVIHKIKCRKYVMMHGTWEYEYTALDKSNIKSFVRKTVQNIRWKQYFHKYNNLIPEFDGAFHLHKQDKSFEYFENHGQKNNYELVNAVDERLFNSKSEKLVEDKVIFIQIANYSFQKNQELAIRTFAEAKLEEAELWFVGSTENDYCSYIKKVASECALKNVRFYCGISREELFKLIAKADVFLLTSISEHLPVTILEGLAVGKPFISTDVGVVNAIPGGICCRDKADLVSAIKLLYENPQERAKLAKIGKVFLSRVAHYHQNFREKVKLIFDKEFTCGIAICDLETRLKVLINRY